jgi:hypothetical protein
MSMCVSLFTVAIAVNYAGEFRKLFEAATYMYVKLSAPFNFTECKEISLVNGQDLSRSKSLTLCGVKQVASLIYNHHKVT